jgi:hypothetical protein
MAGQTRQVSYVSCTVQRKNGKLAHIITIAKRHYKKEFPGDIAMY